MCFCVILTSFLTALSQQLNTVLICQSCNVIFCSFALAKISFVCICLVIMNLLLNINISRCGDDALWSWRL